MQRIETGLRSGRCSCLEIDTQFELIQFIFFLLCLEIDTQFELIQFICYSFFFYFVWR